MDEFHGPSWNQVNFGHMGLSTFHRPIAQKQTLFLNYALQCNSGHIPYITPIYPDIARIIHYPCNTWFLDVSWQMFQPMTSPSPIAAFALVPSCCCIWSHALVTACDNWQWKGKIHSKLKPFYIWCIYLFWLILLHHLSKCMCINVHWFRMNDQTITCNIVYAYEYTHTHIYI